MSNNKSNGGPAFPRAHGGHEAMTMHQYYKAAALQGILANHASDLEWHKILAGEEKDAISAAKLAGKFADAMIAEDIEFEKQ